MQGAIIKRTSKRVFAGFTSCVCTDLALIAFPVVACAAAGTAANHTAPAATSKSENVLLCVIERNLQRLQKSQILRRYLELRRLALFRKNFLVDLDMQRLEKTPVVRGDFRVKIGR